MHSADAIDPKNYLDKVNRWTLYRECLPGLSDHDLYAEVNRQVGAALLSDDDLCGHLAKAELVRRLADVAPFLVPVRVVKSK